LADAKYKYEGEGPAPGSPEAGEQGCRCPVLDNARGYGYLGIGPTAGWWRSGNCPLHGTPLVEQKPLAVD